MVHFRYFGLAGSAEDLFYYGVKENPDADKYFSWNSPHVEYGVSDNWDWQDDNNGLWGSGLRYTFIANPSVGLDLGAVYEFRPK